jgi:type I restriction enzyme M protein
MIWIAPSGKDTATATLERRLWDAADTATRVSATPKCEATWRDSRGAKDDWSANPGLKSQEYSAPALGLIFLRFPEVCFAAKRAQLESPSPLGGERAGVRGDSGHPRPSHGGGAAGQGGRFNLAFATPPFNVNVLDTAMRVSARRHPKGTPQDLPARQDHERLKEMVAARRRFPFGPPRNGHAVPRPA